MEKKKCDICGRVFEGYTENQAQYQLEQHLLSHKFGKLKVESKKNEKRL